MPYSSAKEWFDATNKSYLFNMYGPTEATVAFTVFQFTEETKIDVCKNGIVPIGHPFPHLECLIVDGSNNQVLDNNGVGELLLSGAQVALGYFNNDILSKEKFVNLSFKNYSGVRWYRTGDLVSYNSDVGLQYLERIDHQIKIMGYRIEIGEVEHIIKQFANVNNVVVIGWSGSRENKVEVVDRLIAFVEGVCIDKDGLIEYCKQQLPNYMVPKEVHQVDTFPYNINGKIDRNKLYKLRAEMI